MNPDRTSVRSSTPFREGPWNNMPLFRGLEETALGAVTDRLTLRPFAAGDILIHQDVWCGQLFIIRSGIVEISLEPLAGRPGEEVILGRLVGGECFGEMSLITGALPSATARARTDGEAWVLTQADFLYLALMEPQISRNTSAILSERLSHANRRKVEHEPMQVVVAACMAPFGGSLARALARLAQQPILFVDCTEAGEEALFHLTELLTGRLRPGTGPSGEQSVNPTDGLVTTVRGVDDKLGGADSVVDLPVILNRLAGHYQYGLVALPIGHPLLTPDLLAVAARVLLVGPISPAFRVREALATLPIPQEQRNKIDLGLVLTEVPRALQPTVAMNEALGEDLGAPVRALLPTSADGLPAAIDSLARWLVGQRIGLALGAGGAKGWAHLGVLRALHRAGIPFDCVAGVSIGAIVGAAVATGATTEWIEWAFQAGTSRVFRPTIPIHGILSNRTLAAWLNSAEMYGNRRMEDMAIPFAVIATDLNEGREIVIRRGPVWQAVLASAAIPAIYPPVRLGSHLLVDGGVVNPVPVSTAHLLGADVIIAVDLSEPLAPRQELRLESGDKTPHLPSVLNNILRSRDIMMSEIRMHTVREPSILIKPRIKGIALRDFSEGKQFVEAGESAVEMVLPELAQHLPWLGQAAVTG